MKLNNFTPEENSLLPLSTILRLAHDRGIYLGNGKPENRIAYFIKAGLLPHAVRRKNPATGKIEAHFPISILETISQINHSGTSVANLADSRQSLVDSSEFSPKTKDHSPIASTGLLIGTLVLFVGVLLFTNFYTLSYTSLPQDLKSKAAKALISLIENELKSINLGIQPLTTRDREVLGDREVLQASIGSLPLISPTNLIINSSFEGGLTGYSIIGQSTNSNTKVGNESVRSGTQGLRIEDNNACVNCQLGVSQVKTTTINGRNYILSLYIRTKDLTGSPKLRIGLFGNVSTSDPVYLAAKEKNELNSSYYQQYSSDKFEDFELGSISVNEWIRISSSFENLPLGKYPIIEVIDYQGGTIFIDDISLNEGASSLSSLVSGQKTNDQLLTANAVFPHEINNIGLGGNSVVADSYGNLYPSSPFVGTLGTKDNTFKSLYIDKLTINNGNLSTSGTIEGKSITSSSTTTSTFAGDLSITGNIDITGVYKKDGTSGKTVSTCGASQYLGGIAVTGGIITTLGSCTTVSSSWSGLTDPTANLALSMAAYTTTFTYNAATGTSNLFNLTDTASNTGTGYLLNLTTATSSTLLPFRVQARGNTIIDTTATGGVTIGNATSAQAVTIDAGTATLNLGNSNNAKTINIGTGTAADTINIGSGGTTADTLTFGNTGVGTTFTFNSGATIGDILTVTDEASDTTPFVINNAGNVGIGKTNPTLGKLHIDDPNFSTGWLVLERSGAGKIFDFVISSNSLIIRDVSDASATRIRLHSTGGVSIGSNTDPGANNFTVPSGNVGIGTTSPGTTTRLNIAGDVTSMVRLDRTANASVDAIFEIAPTFLSAGLSFLHIGTTTTTGMYIADTTGNVGIGTATISSLTSGLTLNSGANFEINTAGTSNLDITTLASTGGDIILGPREGAIAYITTQGLGIAGSDGLSASIGLDINREVQINFPTAADTVIGVCKSVADGTAANNNLVECNGTPGDIAEWYETEEGVEEGDLVATTNADFLYEETLVDPRTGLNTEKKVTRKSSILAKSSKSYQNNVIGVVSESPYQVFGEAVIESGAKNPRPVALVGRVPVKVTSENGEVKVGDFLTSSATKPGFAMAACSREPGKQCKPGRTIGIALEPFAQEQSTNNNQQTTGRIMVFVNPSWYDPQVYLTSDGNLNVNSITAKSITLQGNNLSNVIGLSDKTALSTSSGSLTTPSSTPTASSSAQLTANDQLLTANKSILSRLDSLEKLVLSLNPASIGGAQVSSQSASFDTLTVLNKLITADLGITGKITNGLLSINGLASQGETLQSYATIDTLSGDLHLQSQGLGGINFLNGKITIDTSGNLKIFETLSAKTIRFDELKSGDQSAGHGVISAGSASVDVTSSLVNESSKILVTPSVETGGKPLIVKSRADGVGFKVLIEALHSSDITFDWLIVN